MGPSLPQGECLGWSPTLVAVELAARLVLVAGYGGLTATLLRMYARNGSRTFRVVPLMFAGFIAAAGACALVEVAGIWVPLWPLDASARVASAILAASAAVTFRPVADRIGVLQLRVRELEEELRGGQNTTG